MVDQVLLLCIVYKIHKRCSLRFISGSITSIVRKAGEYVLPISTFALDELAYLEIKSSSWPNSEEGQINGL